MAASNPPRDRRTVQINYGEFRTDDDKSVHEGRYVPDDALPFRIEDAYGTWFTFDGTPCELLGDMGGHAVYRHRNDSVVRTIDWDSFVQEYYSGHITLSKQ